MQRKLDRLSTFARKWRLKISPEKSVVMVFNRPPAPMYECNLSVGGVVLRRVEEWTHNGFLVTSSGRWGHSVNAHLERKIGLAAGAGSTLIVLWSKIGMPSPRLFYNIYRVTVESKCLYAVESLPMASALLVKRLEDLQMKMVRCALGVPKSSNRLLVLSDIGAVPLWSRVLFQSLKFLVYALRCPDSRVVRCAVLDSMKLADWNYGWFFKLRASSLGLLDFLDPWSPPDRNDPKLLSLPQQFLEKTVGLMRARLWGQLESGRHLLLQQFPPPVEYCEKGVRFSPYTGSIFRFARAVARLRTSTHPFMIEKGRHLRLPREARLCPEGCGVVEDEFHALLGCDSVDDIREELRYDLGKVDSAAGAWSKQELMGALVNPGDKCCFVLCKYVAVVIAKAEAKLLE